MRPPKIITIGQALIRQKEALPHGSFLSWIESEFGMGEQTARNMMNVAKKFGKSPTVGDLSVTALYELASSTADVRAEVERRIAAGEIVSAVDVKKMKQQAVRLAVNEG
jgi:hypothetical protein